MKIIGIAGSPRCGGPSSYDLEKVIHSKDIQDTIHDISYEGKVSNSEALLLAAMWGAHQEGADVEICYAGDSLPSFDGVVLATPVYFGDRSSDIHNFISTVDLKGKAVGVVSSGAKRNGGQETTNIYALYDCLDKGALITGNGPPTAQYGGTGWAGNKSAIANDDFGIKTSFGTGRQVAKLAHLALGIDTSTKPPPVKILYAVMTKDPISFSHTFGNAEVRTLEIFNKKIKKCVGCPVCPNGDLKRDYKCILQDDMREIREAFIWADCVIFVTGPSYSSFQLFIERTRFIRRNHFDLGERVYSNMSYTNSLTDITPIRIMTNMLRQNMYGLPFFKQYKYESNMHIVDYNEMIEKYAHNSAMLRRISGVDHEYTAVGYEDAKIDEKAYRD
jgi:multimeric flavodoxin WrbA